MIVSVNTHVVTLSTTILAVVFATIIIASETRAPLISNEVDLFCAAVSVVVPPVVLIDVTRGFIYELLAKANAVPIFALSVPVSISAPVADGITTFEERGKPLTVVVLSTFKPNAVFVASLTGNDERGASEAAPHALV